MRLKNHFVFCLACIFSLNSFAQNIPAPKWTKEVGSRSFPKSQKVYYVNDFGAVIDTSIINTSLIQKAIDECASKGGGIVAFKPGTYVTGALFLKSNVNLRIDSDVLILG